MKAWWKEAVVYQIYPRSFNDSNGDGIGDLQGIIQRLDYLADLGIDVIWLSPVYASPNDDNGYDISDYQAIMTDFGTMDDFDELLEKAHQKGLKIMMDLVVNHTSDEHEWFKQSRQSRDNPYRDYYFWRDQPNNWGSFFSGSAWAYDETTNSYYLHLFSKKQVDLNWDQPKVRQAVYAIMNWWLDKGIDGFRMDVINLISKVEGLPDGPKNPGDLYGVAYPYVSDGPHIHDYLQEMYREVLSRKDLMTVGETPGLPPEQALLYVLQDRHELQTVFSFDHVNLDHGPYGKWSTNRTDLVTLKKTLNHWQEALKDGGWNALYWDNHDQPRAVSRFGCDDEKWRVKSAKMLAMCLHMMRGTPYIYQGEELGMTNVAFDDLNDYRDIETLNAYQELVVNHHRLSHEEMMDGIHAKGRDNARTPMQWDDTSQAGFTQGTPWIKVNPNYPAINAASQIHDPDSIYSFYKTLIKLRKQYEVIIYGDFRLIAPDDPNVFAYSRDLDGDHLEVYCNFTNQTLTIEMPDDQILLTNDEDFRSNRLNPYQAVAFYRHDEK